MRRVTLLVCGEPLRGDDGIAQAIIGALPTSTMSLVAIEHVGQLMPDDLLIAGGPLILVDAVEGPAAGEIVDLPIASLLDAHGSGISPASSHALPLPLTIRIAEQLGGALPEGRLIGIAGAAFGLGTGLSPVVRDAVPRCAERLNHWIRVLAHETRPAVCA